jgi:hypothetical protein
MGQYFVCEVYVKLPSLLSEHPTPMLRILAVALLSTIAMAQSASQSTPSVAPSAANKTSSSTELPPVPRGKSTVIGGEIRDVDPIRDQFILKVFGASPVKIYFDERTQVYRNGTKIPVLDLRPNDHASVQTILDGTAIFALRIHTLSQVQGDEFRGQVTSYDSRTGDLVIHSVALHDAIKLRVPPGTPVSVVGQDGLSSPQQGPVEFATGALLNVRFKGGSGNRGVVTGVDVLASPGSSFVFTGKVSFLDISGGRMVIVDPRDNQSYPIALDSSLDSTARKLHEGSVVRVTTGFDGQRYVASQITME